MIWSLTSQPKYDEKVVYNIRAPGFKSQLTESKSLAFTLCMSLEK